MAAPTNYGARMSRCPACNAGLPLDGIATIVTCEYCGARVEIDRRGQPRPQAPAPQHQPQPQTKWPAAPPKHPGRLWSWLSVPLVLMFSGGMAAYQWFFASRSAPVTAPVATPIAKPAPVPQVATIHEATPSPPPPPPESPSTTSEVEVPTPTPTPTPPSTTPTPSAKGPSAGPKPTPTPTPTGPVISVDEARKQLEPKARACMKQANVHHLLAYMGNSTAGPVKVLPDSRTHIDGTKVALAKTALGRCLDEAGAKVRTSAFKSNYVRLDVRNDDVPNPLGTLPKTADMKAVDAVIATHDDQVKACARKHGKEGSREVFHFTIAGPTGKVTLVRATHVAGAFRTCALAIYKTAEFPKVQSASYQTTYSLTL